MDINGWYPPSPSIKASMASAPASGPNGSPKVWDLASKHVLFQMDPMKAPAPG